MKTMQKLVSFIIIAAMFLTVFSLAIAPTAAPTTEAETQDATTNGIKIQLPICSIPGMCEVHPNVAWNS